MKEIIELSYKRRESIKFSEFINLFCENPQQHLTTAHGLINEAVRSFGYSLTVRCGQPIFRYKVFDDPFCDGVNAVYGQELAIKSVMDVFESIGKDTGPPRGIVLVGPPASGKTNIADLICQALEEYTKRHDVVVYSFYFDFEGKHIRSNFRHNPLLLFHSQIEGEDGAKAPRRNLFHLAQEKSGQDLRIPTFFHRGALDKTTLDILDALVDDPANEGMDLYEIIEKYVRIEKTHLSISQARGISNIDNMGMLVTKMSMLGDGKQGVSAVPPHLINKQYEGAIIASNRGVLHIHDAFTTVGDQSIDEREYKPLLMLLGSGRTSLESTQVTIDNAVVITTNLEEMELLEGRLTSSKLIDRIERAPVNYLIDCLSEKRILERDIAPLKEDYDIDPNLVEVAAWFAVLTRLMPPVSLPDFADKEWCAAKKEFYMNITPEQKMFLYATASSDVYRAISKLPLTHPIRNEAKRLGVDLDNKEEVEALSEIPDDVRKIQDTGLFTTEELKFVDDAFMRALRMEHHPDEGKYGISVRQLQNIMRRTVANSDGTAIFTNSFIDEIEKAIEEGAEHHQWLKKAVRLKSLQEKRATPVKERKIGCLDFEEGEADYGDFNNLSTIAEALWFSNICDHITISTVDRDPAKIEEDLRKYIQMCLLYSAGKNKKFGHKMIKKFSYTDPITKKKTSDPDVRYMVSVERILLKNNSDLSSYNGDPAEEGSMSKNLFDTLDTYRLEIAEKYFNLTNDGDVIVPENKNVIYSREDGLLENFLTEYKTLLSNKRTDGKIDPISLQEAFYILKNKPKDFKTEVKPEVAELALKIIGNMKKRFKYSERIALDTIIFAVEYEIFFFANIIN
jgi:hypothetical protein